MSNRFAHCRGKLAIKTGARSIGIHRREQDLARAAVFRLARPFHHAAARGLASALHKYLRIAHRIRCIRIAPRIDRNHDCLRAEAAANGVDQALDRRGRRS